MNRTSSVLFVVVGLVGLSFGGYVVGRMHHSGPEEVQAAGNPAQQTYAKTSYAQQNEDLIVADLLKWLDIKEIHYLDIGAAEPVQDSNTYLFYKQGHRGVLVEPNPAYGPKYREVRPGDKWLEVGVGIS